MSSASSASSLRAFARPLLSLTASDHSCSFVLKVFYSNIVVEGVEHIPCDGSPCILTANHSNSLTDALLLVTTVPRWVSRDHGLDGDASGRM